jgi:hypothetical protein
VNIRADSRRRAHARRHWSSHARTRVKRVCGMCSKIPGTTRMPRAKAGRWRTARAGRERSTVPTVPSVALAHQSVTRRCSSLVVLVARSPRPGAPRCRPRRRRTTASSASRARSRSSEHPSRCLLAEALRPARQLSDRRPVGKSARVAPLVRLEPVIEVPRRVQVGVFAGRCRGAAQPTRLIALRLELLPPRFAGRDLIEPILQLRRDAKDSVGPCCEHEDHVGSGQGPTSCQADATYALATVIRIACRRRCAAFA